MAKPHNPGQLGLFRPESHWKPPTELPDLRGRSEVVIDLETRDDGIAAGKGPGWALGPAGYICGVAYAAEGIQGYAPVRHPETECFPLDNTMRWLSDLFRSGVTIICHNAPYDLGWAGAYGAAPPDNLQDTLAAAVMLDEDQEIYKPGATPYSLDNCCARYGIPGKDTSLLTDAVRAYGGNPKRPAGDLWRLPARYAAPYAEQDGVATLGLWKQQKPQLLAQDVWGAYRTEIELIPMVVAMRRRGIRLDVDRAKAAGRMFRERSANACREISDKLAIGRAVTVQDLRSPKFMEKLFTAEGIAYPRTPTGQGSFSADWMRISDHWLPKAISGATQYEEAANKFIDNYLMGFVHRGRIHAEVHQFKSDSGGTRSHRFSYSEPPLQQMPSPDKSAEIGKAIRQCFLPEKGGVWGAPDYSSQEPRLTVHFANVCKCRGVEAVVQEYNDNPRTDYHAVVARLVNKPRPIAKILNLGMTYGKGKASLAEELGLSVSDAAIILQDYHERLPYIKSLEDLAKSKASTRGYIRLIDGARMHYNKYEGQFLDYDARLAATRAGHKLNPCSLKEAQARQEDPDHPWSGGRLRRADTRTGLNNLVQGSAARQTKIAMLNMWKNGILPLIQIHDEVGVSIESEEELNKISQIMIDAVKLTVPVVVDAEVGDNWGNAKQSWSDYIAGKAR